MAQLQEQMDAWLTGTGLNVEQLNASVPQRMIIRSVFFVQTKQHFLLKNTLFIAHKNYSFTINYDQLSPDK